MHFGSLRFSAADEQYVTACLGQPPKGVVGVAARDHKGRPTVITNLPLIVGPSSPMPFPTLYWLVDPFLTKRIADIERQGGIREIESALQDDAELLQSHLEDNRLYAKTRWAVLTEDEKQQAQQLGLVDVLKASGIGGVADHDQIKCLQAQYAFHLARYEAGTTVGRLMHQRYDLDE